MANYSSLITSPHWQKKHEGVMLIQVRIFSLANSIIPVLHESGLGEILSGVTHYGKLLITSERTSLKVLPVDTFYNAVGDSVEQEWPVINAFFLDSF